MTIKDIMYLLGVKEARIHELELQLEELKRGDTKQPDDHRVMHGGPEEGRSG